MFDSKCDSQKEGLDSTGLETENFKDTKHVKSVGFEFSDDQTDEIATNDQSVSKRPQLQGSASRSASMNAREWTRLRMLRSSSGGGGRGGRGASLSRDRKGQKRQFGRAWSGTLDGHVDTDEDQEQRGSGNEETGGDSHSSGRGYDGTPKLIRFCF